MLMTCDTMLYIGFNLVKIKSKITFMSKNFLKLNMVKSQILYIEIKSLSMIIVLKLNV